MHAPHARSGFLQNFPGYAQIARFATELVYPSRNPLALEQKTHPETRPKTRRDSYGEMPAAHGEMPAAYGEMPAAHGEMPAAACRRAPTGAARSFLVAVLATVVSAGSPGCADDAATFAPYEGSAYPNRRPTFEQDGRLLGYVANSRSDAISVIDLDGMTNLGNVPVGRDPVDIDGPRHIALDDDAGVAYVALSYPLDKPGAHDALDGVVAERPGYLLALDLADLKPIGDQRLGANLEDLVLSSDRNVLVASHYDALRSRRETELEDRRTTVDFVHPAAGLLDQSAQIRRLKVCVTPSTIVSRSDGTRAYVACTGEDSIAVLNTEDSNDTSVIARVPAGPLAVNQPYGLVANPTEERLAVSNKVARMVVVLSMTDEPEQLTSIQLTGVPQFVGWISDTEFIVPAQDTIEYNFAVLVDTESASIVREATYPREVCGAPREVRKSTDGRVFMLCEESGYNAAALVQLDPTTLEVLGRVDLGFAPDRLTFREP
jgi:YVTN family beta-propeller protein